MRVVTGIAGSRRTATRAAVALLALALLCLQALPSALAAAGGCARPRTDLSPDAEEKEMVRRINDYRSQAGQAPLIMSPTLMAAAAWKSNDLGVNAYFGHDDSFRTWTQRFVDCGYGATSAIAENLAAGYPDAASTFEQWRTSAGHNANMLNASMRAVGVARAHVVGSPYGWYWTSTFGAIVDGPVAAAIPAPDVTAPAPALSAPSVVSGLALNGTAIVFGTGADGCLRVRAAPSLTADIVACLPDGSAMVLSDGPVNADGYTWWWLGALGWAVSQYLTVPGS